MKRREIFLMKKIKALLGLAACASMILVSVHSGQASTLLPLGENVQQVKSQNLETSKIHPSLVELLNSNREGTVNVIVSKKPGSTGVLETAKLLGAKIKSEWEFINTFSAEMKVSMLEELAAHEGIVVINEDSKIISTNTGFDVNNASHIAAVQNAYTSSAQVQGAWEQGITGKGVTVAVVDSGVSRASVNDFGSRFIGQVSTNDDLQDRFGHGTHIAGIIAGDGAASHGKYVGVAPGANILSVKYSDHNGMSTEADLVNALHWIYQNRDHYNIRVVNISSTVGTKSRYTESATAAAVELLWGAGVVVVTSAGNNGYDSCSTCSAPANDPFVITVGAIDDNGTKAINDDFQKPWSSAGTTMSGVYKPEVVAPGTNIVSYMPYGKNRNEKPENVVDGKYFKMGGTSMAAPVVSGVVALMLEANPHLTPNQIKWLLQYTARDYIQIKDRYLSRLSKEQKDNLDIDNIHTKFQEWNSGDSGVVNADLAVYYALNYRTDSIPDANQNYAFSPIIFNGSTNVTFGTATWSNATWSNATWSNATWSNATWSNATWSNATWSNVYWK
jgi:serine protease AprX